MILWYLRIFFSFGILLFGRGLVYKEYIRKKYLVYNRMKKRRKVEVVKEEKY